MYDDLIGCKYKEHGRNKEEGFDCYGLIIEVLRRNNIIIPDVFYECENEHQRVSDELFSKLHYKRYEKPERLCIIVFNVTSRPIHVGVYLEDGLFIHSTKNGGVVIENLNRWQKRVQGYYKVSDSQYI